jgi:hypothetical protein
MKGREVKENHSHGSLSIFRAENRDRIDLDCAFQEEHAFDPHLGGPDEFSEIAASGRHPCR